MVKRQTVSWLAGAAIFALAFGGGTMALAGDRSRGGDLDCTTSSREGIEHGVDECTGQPVDQWSGRSGYPLPGVGVGITVAPGVRVYDFEGRRTYGVDVAPGVTIYRNDPAD